MARPPRVDVDELDKLLNEQGKTPSQCAKHFGVSRAAISQARRKLSHEITHKTASEAAPIVYQRNLDTVEQLQKINHDANEILDLLMRWGRGENEALQILESQKTVRVGKKEEQVVEYRLKDPRELALKAMGEIRNQLKLQLDIYQALYDVRAAEEFQREVLEAIGEVAPDVRDRIVSNLQEKRAIRSAVQFA